MSATRTESAIRLAQQRLREPIPVEPFLCWAVLREREIGREIDRSTVQISGDRETTNAPRRSERASRQLLMEIGWDPEAGERRLYRWINESLSGLVERADVEDALDHADVLFWEVYPDLPPSRGRGRPRHKPSFMTPEQLRAAHVIYMQAGRMTMADVAALIWERYNFANPEAARCALRRGWRILGLPERRKCVAITGSGERCEKAPLSGEDHCAKHDKRITRGWEPPRELVDRARSLHEAGLGFKRIGVQLCDETPWAHPTYVAKRFALIAHAEGWHRNFIGGRPPLAERKAESGMERAA